MSISPQGRHRRDLPPQSPRQVPLDDDRDELAPQLGHRLLNPLPRQLGPRKRQPPIQDLLHLGRMLSRVHHLRVFHDL